MTSRIILAADGLSLEDTVRLVSRIGKRLYAVKIHELFDAEGRKAVDVLRAAGASRIWIDAKLHDIPKTVDLRAAALAKNGADIVSVHAAGGPDMMRAAVESGIPEVFAITVLTSLSEGDVRLLYWRSTNDVVHALAISAESAGVQGIVCSPMEVSTLRSMRPHLDGRLSIAQDVKLVVPGVRSHGVDTHDQCRVGTPSKAIQDGASLLVIGRQITKAEDPAAALDAIEKEIADA